MIYLKTFERFFDPSNKEKDEIMQTCNDILLELPEEYPHIEYKLDFESASRMSFGGVDLGRLPAKIIIRIDSKDDEKTIKYKSIEEYIDRLTDYLKSIGLKKYEFEIDGNINDWKNGKIEVLSYKIEFSKR